MAPTDPVQEAELQALVLRAQDGDTEAFGEIYDLYATPVYRYVVFRFPQELAEDLVADVFVKTWEKLHTYKRQQGVPFSAWLFRIARHSVIDAYRVHRGFEEIPEALPDDNRDNQPRARLERAMVMRTVRKAMNELPRRYRDALLLSYVADLSHADIARVLNVREGTVRILKFRALKRLQKLLPPSLKDFL